MNPRNSYESARYYAQLAETKKPWPEIPANSTYSANPVPELKYKGQDINLGKCHVNNIYHSVPPGTEYITHVQGPTSSSRTLMPTMRLPDGQYLYPNMIRYEPILNGKRFMYDTPFEDMNPIPGIKQTGYRYKLYPLTDEYARELSVFTDNVVPYPNF